MHLGIKQFLFSIVILALLGLSVAKAQQRVEFSFHNDNLVFSQDVTEFFKSMRGGISL